MALENGDAEELERAFRSRIACKIILPILRLGAAVQSRQIAVATPLEGIVAHAHAHALLLAYQPHRAIDIIARALADVEAPLAGPLALETRLLLARCYLKAGAHIDALEILHEAATRFPQNAQPDRARLNILLKIDPAAALKSLAQIDARHPDRVDRPLRAAICVVNNLVDQALCIFEHAPAVTLEELAALTNALAAAGRAEAWAKTLAAFLTAASRSDAARVAIASPVSRFHALQARVSMAPPNGTPPAPVVVIMCVHNGEDTLAHAADSVLQQTWRDLRLVMVDDASDDGTLSIMRELAKRDPRVIVMLNDRNLGIFQSKNAALSLVHGDYYTSHDADDWMHPERLARALAVMRANPELKGHYTSYVRMTASGAIETPALENRSSGLFPRSVIEEMGGFDCVRFSGDAEFQWRLRARYGGQAVRTDPEVMAIGMRREGSLTSGGTGAFDAFGHNGVRIEYARAFLDWHLSCDDPAELRLDPDAPTRPFDAPGVMIAPQADLEPEGDRFGEAPGKDACETQQTPLVVRWPDTGRGGRNWGDKLNPVLVQALSDRAIVNSTDTANRPAGAPVYFVVGSGLASAGSDAVVWGSGFIRSDQILKCRPDQVLAVRGPLTRRRVVEAGGDPSLPLGDPALLLPLFHLPVIPPQFDIGVIQHFRDAGTEPLPRLPRGLSARIIDITGGIRETIDAVLSCRMILSSSLHGLIIAHAYGREAAWLKFSDRPLGDDFKFRDYWASIGWPDHAPHDVRANPFVNPTECVAVPRDSEIDLFSLIGACPFISMPRKRDLTERAIRLSRGETIFARHAGLRCPLSINIEAGS